MKLNSLIICSLFFIGSALMYQSCISEASANTQTVNVEIEKWTSLDKAIQLSKKDNKKILVDVYTDWCKWCKVMDKKTLENESMKAYLQKNYHLVKFNAEQKEDIIYKGKSYSYTANGTRGYHALAPELLDDQLSYPSLVVLDSNLDKVQTIRGYKTPEQLKEILK